MGVEVGVGGGGKSSKNIVLSLLQGDNGPKALKDLLELLCILLWYVLLENLR